MDSCEVRAFPFSKDPVGYLKMVYLNLLDSGYDEQDAVLEIIDEFAALVAAVADGNILSDDTNLNTYIYADNAYQQKISFITIMKAVGIRRDHLKGWLEIEMSDSTGEELLEERSYRRAILEVYGSEES